MTRGPNSRFGSDILFPCSFLPPSLSFSSSYFIAPLLFLLPGHWSWHRGCPVDSNLCDILPSCLLRKRSSDPTSHNRSQLSSSISLIQPDFLSRPMLLAELLSESCHFSCGSDYNHEEESPCPTPVPLIPTPVLHFASTGTHTLKTAEAPKVVWGFRQGFGFQVWFRFRVWSLGFTPNRTTTFDQHFSVWSNHVCQINLSQVLEKTKFGQTSFGKPT